MTRIQTENNITKSIIEYFKENKKSENWMTDYNKWLAGNKQIIMDPEMISWTIHYFKIIFNYNKDILIKL